MITNILNTIQKTFTDGFAPKPVAMLPASSKHVDVYVSPDLPAFNGRFFSQEVTRLATSDEHRAILKDAFQKAASRVVIVSPFITLPAITADGIHALVRAAVQRGVTVSIYADDRLNLDAQGRIKETCRLAVADLTAAGATVTLARAIHNKTLCIDDRAIVEGSYNWLSAVRDSRSHNQRQECSIVYCGIGVREMIRDAMREVAPAH